MSPPEYIYTMDIAMAHAAINYTDIVDNTYIIGEYFTKTYWYQEYHYQEYLYDILIATYNF